MTTSNVPPTLTDGQVLPPLPFATLALDTATGDIDISPTVLQGSDAIAQKVRCRFKFFLGEWFLDTRLGVPYLQSILVKGASLIVVNAILSQVLIKTAGVKTVASFSTLWDKATRTITTNFEAKLDDGSTLTFTDEPFIIGPT